MNMDMPTFLAEIEHAVTVSLDVVWNDQNLLNGLQSRVAALKAHVSHGYQQAQSISMNAEDADDVMLSAGVYWDTYFGSDKDLHQSSIDMEQLEDLILIRKFSRAAQSGSVLQYAKQGLSLVHGGKPKGMEERMIGSQRLSNVIWQARNQAIHWEEGNLNQDVASCFQSLSQIDPCFSDLFSGSLAFDVLKLLGWQSYKGFKQDMLLLGKTKA